LKIARLFVVFENDIVLVSVGKRFGIEIHGQSVGNAAFISCCKARLILIVHVPLLYDVLGNPALTEYLDNPFASNVVLYTKEKSMESLRPEKSFNTILTWLLPVETGTPDVMRSRLKHHLTDKDIIDPDLCFCGIGEIKFMFAYRIGKHVRLQRESLKQTRTHANIGQIANGQVLMSPAENLKASRGRSYTARTSWRWNGCSVFLIVGHAFQNNTLGIHCAVKIGSIGLRAFLFAFQPLVFERRRNCLTDFENS